MISIVMVSRNTSPFVASRFPHSISNFMSISQFLSVVSDAGYNVDEARLLAKYEFEEGEAKAKMIASAKIITQTLKCFGINEANL